MDNKLKEQLLQDYQIAMDRLSAAIHKNNFVGDPDYLSPTIRLNSNMPLDNEAGEFQHYKKIRDALEAALLIEKIPANVAKKVESCRPPEYLTKLFS